MLRRLGLWIEREIYNKASTGDRHENVVNDYCSQSSASTGYVRPTKGPQGPQLHILPMLWVHMRYSQPISETSPPEAALGLVDHSMESIVISTTAIQRISFFIFPFS